MAVKTLAWEQALARLTLPGLERNLFSSPDWIAVLRKTYGLQIFVKYIESGGQVESYIVYSVVTNFLEWKICFLSYCDYCDGHVEKVSHWQEFLESLRQDYPRYRIALRTLRDEAARQVPEFKELSRERFHILDLRPDLNELWRNTHDSFKSAVKQGEKLGVVIRPGAKRELPKFYDLHLKVRKNKYKVFPQPYRFFNIIWEQYMPQDKGVLLGAYDPSGNFIAGNVYLICGDTMYYKFNTSSLAALNFRPNNFLFWEGIKLAKARGLKFLDLGSSGLKQEGLIRFKDHTGARMMDIVHIGYEPNGYKFSQKRILKVMTKTFTHSWMPDGLVKVGSHIIYPFLA